MGLDVLIVDDEKNIRTTLRACLEALGCTVAEAASAEQVAGALGRKTYDLAFLDLRLGDTNGLDLLPAILGAQPQIAIVIVTAYATIETAVEAIQRGARDYLPKPFTPGQIGQIVDRIVVQRALEREVDELRSRLEEAAPAIELQTHSPKMRAVIEVLAKAGAHDVPVLLEGENGTGKTVLARHLHLLSPRKDRPFVVVNCPTLSDELLASELFGHTKGAFTGAVRDQPGRVEAAQGGTLFLDEIGEIPPGLQAKLLRFLQDREFERVGESKTRHADVRIVAATNRDLEVEVKNGRFREDLLYRLNTFEVVVPPLRERKEDIVPLAQRFLTFFARATGQQVKSFSKDAEAALVGHSWPGNVRELRNTVERAVILSSARVIGPEVLPHRIAVAGPCAPYAGGDFTIEQIEEEHVRRVIGRAATLDDAARVLGIDSSTLWRKRKRYDER